MRPSLDTAGTTTYSTHPSLTSEASSIISSEQPQTVSEHYRTHSPSHWRLPFSSTTTEKDRNEGPLTPRFAKRLLRLVGSSHHHSTIAGPSNGDELANYAARGSQPIPRPPDSLQRGRPREEAAASWGRASLASGASTTPLASKHSSLGPLPIFPRAPVRTLSRHSSLSSTISQARPRRDREGPAEDDHQDTTNIGNTKSRIEPAVVNPATTPPPSRPASRTAKLRPTLASLFQGAGRKTLHRDDFRKDSYGKDNPPDNGSFTQSVPSTPFRRRFLGLVPDTIRSARSATPSPAPPPVPALPAPVPIPIPVSNKGKESVIPPLPVIKRKRSSLPNPSRKPYDQSHDHVHSHEHTDHEMMNGYSLSYNHSHIDANNPYTIRRSRSDSKSKKAPPSQSHGTSVRVPAGPMQHHPHPHPYFPCDIPLDRGILAHGSFDFERPGTRPSTPGQSQEFLPIERARRSRGRVDELDSGINSGMNPEFKRVLAAGTEARRERRAPSRERLRVIGPMQRSNLPDVTGGDNQFSPDPDNGSFMPPVPAVPATPSMRPRTHMSHGMFPFESPAPTPYGSRVELPLTPPPSKSRRETVPHPTPSRGHHRQLSSSATAVSSPPLPIISMKRDPFYEQDDRSSRRSGREMGILKAFSSPKPSSMRSKPLPEKRVASAMSSPADHYRRGSGSTASHGAGVPIPATYKLDLNTGKARGPSPSSFRQGHFHSQSLSGSTAQSHYATPGQSPSMIGSVLYPELSQPTREDRYYDLCEAMRLSIGESRYKAFDSVVRRYYDRSIPLDGEKGLLVRVQRLLDEAVADGLPAHTARKYYQTLHSVLVDE